MARPLNTLVIPTGPATIGPIDLATYGGNPPYDALDNFGTIDNGGAPGFAVYDSVAPATVDIHNESTGTITAAAGNANDIAVGINGDIGTFINEGGSAPTVWRR